MTIIIIAGSETDSPFVERIIDCLHMIPNPIPRPELYYASAHRETQKVLNILIACDNVKHCLFITVAGRSNALSGVVASNTKHPVIACPPFKGLDDYAVDIHSTLRMPTGVGVFTVLTPENCANAVKRIVQSWKE